MTVAELPLLFDEERRALEPERNIPCDEWAHLNFVLGESSAEPGPINIDRNPWGRGILQAWSNPRISKISIQKSVQSGVTTLAEIMVAYLIVNRPVNVMWAVPTKEDVPHYQKNRFVPMVDRNPEVAEHRTGKFSDEKKRQFIFDRMAVWFRAATSKKDLASDPCGVTVGDECDKWDAWTQDEGNPIKLLEDRTTTFRKRKNLLLSTPSTKHGHIHRNYLEGDQRRYHVPCPECGKYQALEFEQLKCPKSARNKPLKIRQKRLAVYECRFCKAQIADTQRNKDGMLRAGVWVQKGATVNDDGSVSGAYESDHASFHISMLYVPSAWRSWSDVLARWFEVKDEPADLQAFMNQWLGEIYEERSWQTTSDLIKASEDREHREGAMPKDAGLIVVGVDVQKDHFYMTARAFGLGLRSWLIEARRVETWQELENRVVWGTWDGLHASIVCIDSGDGNRTFEIYEFVSRFPDVCRATKGMSIEKGIPLRSTPISKHWRTGKTLPNPLLLWLVSNRMFKDQLARLIATGGAERRWFTHRNTSQDYREQMCSEEKVLVANRRGSGGQWVWRKVKDRAQNHYWDCEVLCLAAARMVGAEALREEDLQSAREIAAEQREREQYEEQRREVDTRAQQREGGTDDYWTGARDDYWD